MTSAVERLPVENEDAGQHNIVAAPPTRVLHLINGEHYSGAERVQDLLALRLGECGFEVGFACLKPGCFDTMRQSRQAALFNAPMHSRFDFAPVGDLVRIIRREGFALLHTHTPRAAVIGRVASVLAGVPMIHHVHSPTTSDSTRRWQNRINGILERTALTRVAGVIAVSESLGRYVRALGVPADRVSVVPNGVPIQGPLARREPPRGAWTLGMVALFRPRKGLEVLLDALAMLRGEGCNVSLRAIGPFETQDYEAKIHEHVARLGLQDAVHWVGFTRDVPRELAMLDLFVLPSLFGEGLPMVILEAMAAGVLVVGTHVEGVPEAIRDGVEGVLAAPGDAHELAAALRRVIHGQLDWSALRAAAHERQAAKLSDFSMAQGVADVYRRVLGTVKPSPFQGEASVRV